MASSSVCRLLLLYHPHVTQEAVKYVPEWAIFACLLLFTWHRPRSYLIQITYNRSCSVTQSHSFMGRQCAKFRSTANCVGLWRTVHFLYPATTYAHCHVPWYKSVIQLGFSLYSIHNLVPVALNSVYPVETFTMLYNLYIVTHPSSSQPFLCTVLWTNIFFALAQSMWRLQKWTLRRSNFSAQ